MSKKIYLFSLVLLALAFTACSETETVDKYDNWRSRNESFTLIPQHYYKIFFLST
jgi:FKBP-type peptidyl-prolyl cis-trans isomerase FklB